MSLRFSRISTHILRFPRVSGDEPGGTITINATNEFSPRERG